MTITLPLPPRELSPNSRCHWAQKAAWVKRYRARTWAAARIAMDGDPPRWERATVQIRWIGHTRMHPDPDNALARCKALFDGLTDAGVFADDRGLTHLPVLFAVDRNNPRIEVTIFPHSQREAA